jgi:hypothetical protein
VLRDVRATLQAAIEHGGLTPASHRKFLNVYHPAINRAAFGPPLRRNEELLALLDAGVIAIHAGPGSRIEIDENDSTYVLNTKFAGGGKTAGGCGRHCKIGPVFSRNRHILTHP